jgi:hypothetical protein
MRYEKRFKKRFENGCVSMEIDSSFLRMTRRWDRKSQELVLDALHKISGVLPETVWVELALVVLDG